MNYHNIVSSMSIEINHNKVPIGNQ